MKNASQSLQLGTPEDYILSVTSTGATLQATTVFGAMRGYYIIFLIILYYTKVNRI